MIQDLLNYLPFFARVIREKDCSVQTDYYSALTRQRDIREIVESRPLAGDPLATRALLESAAAQAHRPDFLRGRIYRDRVSPGLLGELRRLPGLAPIVGRLDITRQPGDDAMLSI